MDYNIEYKNSCIHSNLKKMERESSFLQKNAN